MLPAQRLTLPNSPLLPPYSQVLSTGAQSQGLNAWQVAARLWREEGLKGFRRGMAARTMTMAVGSAVSWTTYESVKKRLARWKAAQQAEQEAQHAAAATAQQQKLLLQGSG